ncbi:hypothetical protein [Nannocystis sp. SCPEA4]|nr:hypothetical protein [Nannocystis sp. SCPEA4]MCY1060406.1 hypothetical protein [Nannocystis sp. SCPEA4]
MSSGLEQGGEPFEIDWSKEGLDRVAEAAAERPGEDLRRVEVGHTG